MVPGGRRPGMVTGPGAADRFVASILRAASVPPRRGKFTKTGRHEENGRFPSGSEGTGTSAGQRRTRSPWSARSTALPWQVPAARDGHRRSYRTKPRCSGRLCAKVAKCIGGVLWTKADKMETRHQRPDHRRSWLVCTLLYHSSFSQGSRPRATDQRLMTNDPHVAFNWPNFRQ